MGRVILSIDSFSEIEEHSFILKQDKWIKMNSVSTATSVPVAF